MKKIFFLPLAAFIVAACSEPTASSANLDLKPSYAKPGSGSGVTVAGDLQNTLFTFGSAAYSATNTTGTTTLTVEDPSGIATASAQTEDAPDWVGEYVLGRLNNQQVSISIASGAVEYSISFDFFAIGSWDGRGQQAQHGNFGQDSWQIAAVCGGTLVDIITTSFSNQKTVQQNYPRSIYAGGGTTWLTGSSGTNETGFDANVPQFDAVKDSWYELSYSGTNPCGNLAFTAIRISIPNFDLQSRFDESWAIDNLLLKTD